MDFGDNIWDVQFDPPDDWSEAAAKAGFGPVRGKRLRRQLGATLSSALWELDPGATQAPYHFHHGGEELLIVLRGTPTLRSPEGERELVEGDVYHWGSLMAGALLGSLPVAILYSFFVEHYVSGMTGAVKE